MTPAEPVEDVEPRDYPGIRRLGYFIGFIVIAVLTGMFASGEARKGDPSLFPQIFALICSLH